MTDSGGSSGRLRDEFGHLPPGDLRQCLLALSPDDHASMLLRQLFNYRFAKGNGLDGHSFGNLFLTALDRSHRAAPSGPSRRWDASWASRGGSCP